MKFWIEMSQQYWLNLTTLTHSYSVQRWFISMSIMSLSTTLKWNSYHSKYIWFIYIHTYKLIRIRFEWLKSFIIIYSLSCCCIYKKRKRQRQQAKQTHNLLLSIVVFVRESYFTYASCIHMLSSGEPKSPTPWLLLSMSTMSISNFEYG